MSEKGRLLKNTGLIAIGNFGAKMIAFILLPLYTSILTTEEYGVYDYIVAISAFLLPIVTLSMHEALFRYIIDTGDKGEKFKKIVSNAFFSVVFGIVAFVLICLAVGVIFKLKNIGYVCLYVIANALYTFSSNLLRGLGKVKEYSIISTAKNFMQLLLNVLCIAVFRWGFIGLLFALCISEFISFIIVVYISRIFKIIKCKYLDYAELKLMLKYSIPLIPNSLGAQIINISDRLVISNFMGASSNGIYSVSYKFPNIIETIYHFFYMAWSESASRIINDAKEKVKEYYQNLYESINKFVFAVILIMIATMPILFRIFIKGEYISGFIYVPILLLAMYFDCIAKFYSGIYTALKKTKIMATSTIIAAMINIIINIIFIKQFGLYAAAYSTLISEIVLVIIRKKYIKDDVIISLKKKDIIIEFIVLFFILFLYDYNNWAKIIMGILIASIYSIYTNRYIIHILIKKIWRKK